MEAHKNIIMTVLMNAKSSLSKIYQFDFQGDRYCRFNELLVTLPDSRHTQLV